MVITCATAGSTLVRVNLPVEALRGYTLYGYAHVKAENVSHRPQSWNGIKVMAVVESPAGKGWAQARVPEGTFDWQEVTLAGRIPADATGLTLCLGLEVCLPYPRVRRCCWRTHLPRV